MRKGFSPYPFPKAFGINFFILNSYSIISLLQREKKGFASQTLGPRAVDEESEICIAYI